MGSRLMMVHLEQIIKKKFEASSKKHRKRHFHADPGKQFNIGSPKQPEFEVIYNDLENC